MAEHHKADPLAGLLARELKRTATSGAGVCPQPEVLAAYFERSLTSAEMAGCETHFAACPRCQQQLAAMARMEAASAPARSAPESATGFWLRSWRWLTPTLAAAGALAIWVLLRPPVDRVAYDARLRSTAPVHSNEALKTPADSKDLRAAEPAKDVVARLERDAALHDRLRKSDGAKASQGSRTARDSFTALSGSGGAGASAPASARSGTTAEDKVARSLSSGYRTAGKTEAAKPADRADRAELAAATREGQQAAAPARIPAAVPVAPEQAQALQKKNEPATVASTVTVEAATEIEAKLKQQTGRGDPASRPVAAEARAALQQGPAQQAEAARARVDAEAGRDAADRKLSRATTPAAQALQTPQMTQAAGPDAQEQNRKARQQIGALSAAKTTPPAQADRAATAAMHEFGVRDEPGFSFAQSPSRRSVWRVGPQGRIEHSQEPKKILELQNSGVTTDLLSGSAPSEKVCWVVGRAGVILLTTDAGKTWQRLGSPSDADIVAVQAADEARATITLAGGKRYATADAGRTWKTPN